MQTCEHCCTKIDGLTVNLGGNLVLDKVDLHVNCGEIVGVVGPNGAGKTTLLRALLGEVPYRGRISFQVSGVVSKRPRIGYVPQKLQFDAGSPISVRDLVVSAISCRPVWAGVTRELSDKVKDILSVFSAEVLLNRRIGELSGGELQRVLLAVAMTSNPELLLLDEPASGVDVKGLSLFYQIVRGLKQRHDISVVLVTHDLAGIATYVDRMILLNRSVVAQGKPEEVLLNEKLVMAFGPSLWNISCLPLLLSEGKDKIDNH